MNTPQKDFFKFMSIKFKLVLLFLFSFSIFLKAIGEQPHHTTAYIAPPNTIETLVSWSRYSTMQFWNKSGKKLPTYNDFHRNSYLIYSEYAINMRNSLFINGGYSTVSEKLNGSSQGINDIELGWKHLISQRENYAFTLQSIAIIPPGARKASYRYGQYGGQIGLIYSQIFCLGNHSGWADFDLGYRFYKGFPSDQVRGGISLGYHFNSLITCIGSGECEYGLCNTTKQYDLNNVTLNPCYKLVKIKLECLIDLYPYLNFTIGGFKHVWGRNVGAGGGFYIGTWILF